VEVVARHLLAATDIAAAGAAELAFTARQDGRDDNRRPDETGVPLAGGYDVSADLVPQYNGELIRLDVAFVEPDIGVAQSARRHFHDGFIVGHRIDGKRTSLKRLEWFHEKIPVCLNRFHPDLHSMLRSSLSRRLPNDRSF
jgi:hypothetical protein